MGILSWPVIHLMIYYLPVQSIQLIFDKKGILLQPGSHLRACVYRFQHKTESIRKLSNFNFQWTKALYQNNLNNITFFFTFFKG